QFIVAPLAPFPIHRARSRRPARHEFIMRDQCQVTSYAALRTPSPTTDNCPLTTDPPSIPHSAFLHFPAPFSFWEFQFVESGNIPPGIRKIFSRFCISFQILRATR